ncbi:MAG: DUF3347 domain-containing protein, partial [Verrucomicrobia bacterium]|nr:DUF3347 domain-containing protein [Cytophagales bacterium]
MKITQISMIALFSLASAVAFAQHEHHPTETKTEPQTQDLGKLDKTVKKQLDNVLVTYFDLKDAFTETNAKKAAEKAGNFAKTLEKVETAKMTTAQQSFFAPLAKSMNTKAKYIAQLKEVEDQRLTFETVSGNILTLVKNLKFNDSPVY